MGVEAGTTTVGNYRILSFIAEGAFGAVYLGEHTETHRRAAIKVLKPLEGNAAQVLAEKARQVNILVANTPSDYVVDIYDAGLLTLPGEQPRNYTVMELLEGLTLRDLLERERRIEPRLALRYVEQAARGVVAITRAGAASVLARISGHDDTAGSIPEFVHRDLKPANLFLTHTEDGEPRVKVMDFDAGHLAEAGTGMLATLSAKGENKAIGTIPYMSPELLREQPIDGRSDMWALGIILYELIEGQRPFGGTGTAQVMVNIISNRRVGWTLEHPPELVALIDTCLAPDRAQRFPNMGAFIEAVRGVRRSLYEVGSSVDHRPSMSSGVDHRPSMASSVDHDPSGESSVDQRPSMISHGQIPPTDGSGLAPSQAVWPTGPVPQPGEPAAPQPGFGRPTEESAALAASSSPARANEGNPKGAMVAWAVAALVGTGIIAYAGLHLGADV
ncbi:MAG: serine/threonine-protein kinase, partial [Myxococcota bacterium]